MKKYKGSKNKQVLSIAVAAALIVGGVYLISNYSGKVAGTFGNLGAVSAGVSSTDTIPLIKGAIYDSAAKQPVVKSDVAPTLKLKYNNAGEENNIVVEADYSVYSVNKVYISTNSIGISVVNTLYQFANAPLRTEVTAVDGAKSVPCVSGSCYVIPAGKTVNFHVRQVYDSQKMFSGVYTARLSWLYYLVDPNSYKYFYYVSFPAPSTKLNTVTIVGEKSPYLYTTNISVSPLQKFTLKGARLSDSKLISAGSTAWLNIIDQSDDQVTLSLLNEKPGVYQLYMSHPTYGNSNSVWVEVVDPQRITVRYPNGGEILKFSDIFFAVVFKPIVGSYHYINLVDKSTGTAYDLSPAFVSSSTWPILGVADNQSAVFDTRRLKNIPSGSKFKIEVCTSKLSCDESDNYITIVN